jgi:hypothetical protein
VDDRYTPRQPRLACCPHCATEIEGAPVLTHAIEMAMLHCCCPRCAGRWDEWRTPAAITRYWATAPGR